MALLLRIHQKTCLGSPNFLSKHLASRLFSRSINSDNNQYDLVVIGGGSGGLACAKEAAEFGKRVAVLDYVEPSTQGTRWGLGGTCVNVGCIPKKMMHLVAQLGENLNTAKLCGWQHRFQSTPSHDNIIDWTTMSSIVQDYVRSLNWGHRVKLQEKSVRYLNAKGSFLSPHSIHARDKSGQEHTLNASNIIIAVGGRPTMLDFPGAKEHCITSDDIFWMKKPPGKTLVIGGSYVALECAGFLHGMGFEVNVMVRSITLRHFDQQMAKLVTQDMEQGRGIPFLWKCIPTSVEKNANGRLRVTWKNTSTNETSSDEYDTVLIATGRTAVTRDLNLDVAKVNFNKDNMKIIGGHGGDGERSSQKHIYAIGDVLEGGIELTPVAIKAGKLLAHRLFNSSTQKMDYSMVPTTVFTPLEYGCVGLSEEAALSQLGADNIEVFHAFYKPLEYVLAHREHNYCYIKVICDRHNDLRVLGFHVTGLNAGEITQGFAAAVKLGITYNQLVDVVGIHPTSAEEVVKLNITKSSGQDANVTGC